MSSGESPKKRGSEKSQDADSSQITGTVEKAEAAGAFGGAQQDVKNLKGNFEEQQAMIGQLREILRNKEASKMQEKEIEDYATRLAKMKPRLTRRRGREKIKDKDTPSQQDVYGLPEKKLASLEGSKENLSESSNDQANIEGSGDYLIIEQKKKQHKVESEDLTQPSASQQESNTRSRILLLRKQLEENRIKFERQQRENLDKRAAMDDMKERIEKLRMEVEQRDTVIQSLQEVDSLQRVGPNVQHLYQQILHKDNTILELTDKVNHLEGVIHDQLEQINEKNQVITARTEAVTLITKDKDEKLMKTIQELEDVRTSLKNLRESQNHKEKQWKEKETSYEDSIALNVKKISVMEDNYQKIESIRFELSARNAELQEKLVFMQCETKNLRKQLREVEITSEERSQELEEIKKKLVRAEAFGQKKLKALEKQIKSLSTSEANFGEEILELQNRVAELEEEKGNLQLKLVDFDDIKLQSEKLKESVIEGENKIETLNSEILSQISTITQHEKEKIALIEELNMKDLKINNLEETISRQLSEVDDIKQGKITLELRLCEIEEERDLAQKEKKDLENEFTKEREFQSSEVIVTNYEDEFKKCVVQLEEKEFSLSKLEELIGEKDLVIRRIEEEREEKQNENQCLISLLAEKENQISSQSIKLENHDSLVKNLHEEIFSKDNDIKNLHIQCESFQQEIDSLINKLNESDLEVKELHTKLDRYKEEIEANKNSIALLTVSEQNLRSTLEEKETLLLSVEGEILTLREELCTKEESFANCLNKIDHMDSVLQSREKEILNLESEIADKLKEISQQETKCIKYEKELESLNRLYHETEVKLTSECDVISCLLTDKENQVRTLNEHIEIKMVELKNSEQMCSNFEQEICEKNKLFDSILEEKNVLLQEISELRESLNDLEYKSSYKNNDITNLHKSLGEKCFDLEDLKEKFNKNLEVLNSKEEMLSSIEAQNKCLENELQNLRSLYEAVEYQLQKVNDNLLNKENECSLLSENLIKKDSQINELRESLDTVSVKGVEIAEYQNQVQSLENSVLEKDSKLKEFEKELECCRTSISQMSDNIIYLQKESKDYKSQVEELSVKLEQSVQELSRQLHIKEQESLYLQEEIENKNALIITLQSENGSACKEFSKIDISELQHELANKTAEVKYLKEIYETELQDIRMQNEKLKEALTSTSNLLSGKDSEFSDLKKLYDEQNIKISHLEEFEKLFVASSSSEELEKLKNKITELENTKSDLEREIASKEEKHFGNRGSHPHPENSGLLVSVEEKLVNQSIKSEHTIKSDEYEFYVKENKILKKQLEEAQQAISRLETSLATETNNQSSSQEGLDEWGIVDLGEPSISDHSKLSMQTSLMEKDKALTVTQEQLKIALEEVNAANDEKKIVQHQMNTLEAELSHKDKKILNLENQILDLKKQVTGIEKTSSELLLMDESSQSNTNQNQEIHKGMSIEGSYSEQKSAIPWFKTCEEAENTDVWNTMHNIEQQRIIDNQASSLETQNLGNNEAHSLTVTREDKETFSCSEEPKQQEFSIQELQYKLSWYEENWSAWIEHYTQLQVNLQSAEELIASLNKEMDILKNTNLQSEEYEKLKLEKAEIEDSLSKLNLEQTTSNELNLNLQSQLERANQEIFRLKDVETQVSELQGKLQTLQHQCSVLETKASDSEENATKVREYEMLYGEIQTCMQEAETKREGSKSRVQELELMVQSAESEISRLRQDLERLTNAGNAIEEERNSLQIETENLKVEIRKSAIKRESFEKENDRLQREVSTLQLQSTELQDLCRRNRGEIDQLKSEVEILEGENERSRSNYDIIEADLLRLRHENEGLTQNFQILGAEKESLETEIQRILALNSSLTFERDRIRGEAQRITEVATSAESEIARLKSELENLSSYPSKYNSLKEKFAELEEKFQTMEILNQSREVESTQEIQLEEVDWGTEGSIEDEHLQRSSNMEKNFQELKELKEKVIKLEKERNELNEEIQSQKLKNGKLIQKLKAANNKNENLIKEMQKLKAKAGGFSDLDMALEEEWKSRISKVEGERDELKIKIDELEKEKNHMKTQLDVLDMAQDKYIQLKESQDDTIRSLSSRNESLAGQIASLEWKISELEENLHLQNQSLGFPESQNESSLTGSLDNFSSLEETLRSKITSIEEEICMLKSENAELVKDNEELQSKLKDTNKEIEETKSFIDDIKDAKSKLETNCNTYKTSYLELHTDHETLQENYTKLNKELQSIKDDQATLKSAYDVLYEEYHQLQENRDSVRLELGIIIGERDKLQEEVYSLNNQLQALQEEEEEEIIKALQDECADLREQNNNLKDEITRMNESVRQMEETVERTKHSLDQEADIQDYLRNEIVTKSQQNDSLSTTVNEQEQQLKYMKAEMAALKSKSSQQQQALEMLEPENEKLKKTLESIQEQNKQLSKQVEAADVSLVKLATRSTSNTEGEERFSSLEATELEAALSSLHIRDLRCQQLSIEINKLLEERDGLQLKLSAALRQNQDLTRELSLSQQLPSPQSSTHSLSEKLAELRDLNSSLEQKALDSFRGSNISGILPPSPPTFVSHTAPATPTAMRHLEYTVTRENQGASSTIMNWLLGKSTPKEVLHV